MPCKQPKFASSQQIITTTGLYPLSNNCYVGVIQNVLPINNRDNYLKKSMQVSREQSIGAFNSLKPRFEVCYTIDGEPYKYSGKKHYTTIFPDHVSKLIPTLLNKFQQLLSEKNIINNYIQTSNAVDILYCDKIPLGGSIAAHKDDEHSDWGLVLIYSLGQTRWIRVRSDETKQFYNVRMDDNSLVAMYGKDFQKLFTHQVDKLNKNEEIGTRLSLNIRFLPE